jgi:predicted nuclease with TOPRIM domain
MDEMEKSAALLNERIAELKKDKQVLQDQLARLEGEGLQISDSDYNSKASNSKLRKVLGGQMDKVADMLEKLKALSATSAAASAAAHGEYTQRGGSVKKTDTGVSVSDYEGVLNIFYPQFV